MATAVATLALAQSPEPSTGAGAIPLPALTAAEVARFERGAALFVAELTREQGLGPVFNATSCAGCHGRTPTLGGGSRLTVTLFGRALGGLFDPLEPLGGPLVQAAAIGEVETPAGAFRFGPETVPDAATLVAARRSQPLFGLGLVDAVPDATFYALAASQASDPDRVAGRPNLIVDPVQRRVAVGRFGWKAQLATLRDFSAHALRDEMGLTSPQAPEESCPQGDCALLDFDPRPGIDDDGSLVAAIADFMLLLAPPNPGPATPGAEGGQAVFRDIGCASCHVERLTTGPHPVAALDRVTFTPYSDFLLHDMGALGDGIEQASATGSEMRTAPLWGLGSVETFLHDGRASTLEQAVLAHDGRARPARERFQALAPEAAARLLAFLESL
jgi:CxxC motif-containing protein (DUF1111 family)